jgi:electron transfer flavoprotein alpha subunit
MAKILVVAEQAAGDVKRPTLSVIGFAHQLAERVGGGFDIVTLGPGAGEAAGKLTGYGADKVLAVEGAALQHYLAQPYAVAVSEALARCGAAYVCGPSGTFGKDLLPRVAARAGVGMVAECVGLEAGDELRFRRPMYAGNILATVRVTTPGAVVSVRTTEIDAAAPRGGTSPVESMTFSGPTGGARFVGFDATVSERPELGDATIVVSGGRGLKDGKNFWTIMSPLADALGAAVGASRAVVDSFPEVPNDLQVGQTGKVVAPNLYVAVAISGAIQHLAGMKNSRTIVAINSNPEAPIFQVADYGLVADAFKVVPELVEKLKAAR